MHLGSITGLVQVHLANDKHDFSAHQVEGDISADGHCSDLTLSEIKGRVTMNGEIFGEVHMENVSGPVSLHTSVTDLQVASLPGDLTMNSDDLRVTEAKGQVRVTTHSKDRRPEPGLWRQLRGNRDGRIAVEPAGTYGVEAKNSKGDVEVTLPPNASATVDGHTRNGDIVTEFGLSVSGDESKTVSGRIGSGGAKIILNAQNGDVRIKKGSAFPAAPPPAAKRSGRTQGSRNAQRAAPEDAQGDSAASRGAVATASNTANRRRRVTLLRRFCFVGRHRPALRILCPLYPLPLYAPVAGGSLPWDTDRFG